MPKLTLSRLPPPENKTSGTCNWRGCHEPCETLELFCAPHLHQAEVDWQEVLDRSPGYRAYFYGKED